VKEGVSDPRSQPRTVVNDPALTLDTPDWSWVSTGIRALDHAVEVIYAIRRQPISDTLASKAISLLVEHLPASIGTDGSDQLAPQRFGPIAQGFGVPFDSANPKSAALECAERTAEFIAKFNVPAAWGPQAFRATKSGQ
jgi:alcohol dehydrogenase class IV